MSKTRANEQIALFKNDRSFLKNSLARWEPVIPSFQKSDRSFHCSFEKSD